MSRFMSRFIRLHFWARRARLRAWAVVCLLGKLALLAVAVFLAVEVGKFVITAVIVVTALVIAAFVIGAFTTEWRYAGVRLAQQYRRLTRNRGGHR